MIGNKSQKGARFRRMYHGIRRSCAVRAFDVDREEGEGGVYQLDSLCHEPYAFFLFVALRVTRWNTEKKEGGGRWFRDCVSYLL